MSNSNMTPRAHVEERQEPEEQDHFRKHVKHVVSLLLWGQDTSNYDRLLVASAMLYIKWHGEN